MLVLKKAYAEIILNTAKEAAALVMTSERKALRFQQDLRATKEEALRMLVRLKQMIDSKATEAEMTSLGQQKRIEELEAQLNEAEDVIGDLRTELKQVWGASEKVKSNQARPLNGQIKKEDSSSDENSAADPIRPSLSNSGFKTMTTSDMKNGPLNERVSVDNSGITTKESERTKCFSETDSKSPTTNQSVVNNPQNHKREICYRGSTSDFLFLFFNLPKLTSSRHQST